MPKKEDELLQADAYQLPKIDLSLTVIAALTVYMAYRSRRFIPIAAIAACRVMAMLMDQMVRTISAARNFHGFSFGGAPQNGAPQHKQNHPTIPPMPYSLQVFFTAAAAVAVLTFGTWWGLKFKRIYLDSWPDDPKLNSVFMRMTASHVKPFYACKFIKDNKLAGKMFNYWTEGGFIAWSQEPDPNTGRTPLQLFMDGRAQAAYEPRVYRIWATIMSGGQIATELAKNARFRGRGLTPEEYAEIGKVIDKYLKKYNVWVVLMPIDPKIETFIKGLEHNPNWLLVFFNHKQKLFVDVTTPQGMKLFEDVLKEKALYPDEFSKDLIIAHNMFLFGKGYAEKERGLDFAIKAFEAAPSQLPMVRILSIADVNELRPRVDDFCKNYFDDFTKNKNLYVKQDGYYHRITAALHASSYLYKRAGEQKNTELVRFYAAKRKEYHEELQQMQGPERKTW